MILYFFLNFNKKKSITLTNDSVFVFVQINIIVFKTFKGMVLNLLDKRVGLNLLFSKPTRSVNF